MHSSLRPIFALTSILAAVAPVAAPAAILLNEIHLRTPASSDTVAADGNYEFVELRSTTGGVEPCTDLWVLVIDNEGGNVGEIQEAWPLRNVDGSPMQTGSNGLLLIGNNYSLPDSPWASVKAPQTTMGDPSGMGNDEFSDADAVSILLVRGYTNPAPVVGAANVDIDMDNDGTGVPDWLDPTPPANRYTTPLWTEVVDSVGFNGDQGAVIKVAFTGAGASVSTSNATGAPLVTAPATSFYPHTLARSATNNTANSRAAWYGGKVSGAAVAIDSVIYTSDYFNIIAGQTWKGQVTPGQPNFAGAPVAPVFRINEINLNPPGSPGRSPGGVTPNVPEANDGNFEYIEIINTQPNQAGGANFSGSLAGYTLLLVDNDGGGLGTVRKAWNLGRFATGSNGLLVLGDGYPAGFSPFAAAFEENTQLADPVETAAAAPNQTRLVYSKLSAGDLANDGASFLLVQNWTGLVEQDLDANDDGTLDAAPAPPWTTMTDSVCVPAVDAAGALVAGQGGYTPARADIVAGGIHFNPDNVSRLLGVSTAHVATAWSAGVLGSRDAHALQFQNGFTFTGSGAAFRGAASPGRANYSSAIPPAAGSFLLNEVHINPPTPVDNTEFIEVISTAPHAHLTSHWLIVLDAAPGSSGRVRKVIDLRSESTGANRLAVFAAGVAEEANPISPFIAGRTLRDNPDSSNANGTLNAGAGFSLTPDGIPDSGVSVLLVSYTPPTATGVPATPDADLDANDDGVLDSAPAWTLIDGISTGNGLGGVPVVGAGAALTGSVCRTAGNFTANSAAAWYGGELTGGTATSFGYSANFFGGFKGAASPGRHNVTATPSATAGLLLNEVNINPPGGDTNREFIEFLSTDGSALSTGGYSALLLDNDGGDTGRVLKVYDLDSAATGTNGLLLAGAGYDAAVPWADAAAPEAATRLFSPDTMSPDDIGLTTDNGALTLVLVRHFTGRVGDDLDMGTQADLSAADDHILNAPLPWSALADSAAMRGFLATTDANNVTTYTLEGFIFPGTADLSVPIPAAPNQANGYTPDTIARHRGNLTANTAAAWYGANIQGTSGTSTVYEPAQFFPPTLNGGRVTPGQANVLSIPPITPGNGALAANLGASGKLSAASLAALASGGSGALTVTAVQSVPTARGGRVSLQNGVIIYEPAAGTSGVDSFTYTISDGTRTATGTVTVMIGTPAGASKNIADILTEEGGNRVAGLGIPGRLYAWQISSDLIEWTMASEPVPCPPAGVMSFFDAAPLPAVRYYRLVEFAGQ